MNDKEMDEAFRSIIRRVRHTAASVEKELTNDRQVINKSSELHGMRVRAASNHHNPVLRVAVPVYELLYGDDAAFIHKTYQYVLQREVDEGGLKNYLSRLKQGESRLLIVRELQDSAEGKAQRAQINSWGISSYLVRLHALLRSIPMARLFFVRNIACKVIAKLLHFYEKKRLPKHPLFLLNDFANSKLDVLLKTTEDKITRQLHDNTSKLEQKIQQQLQQLSEHLNSQNEHLASHKEWLLNHNRDIEQLTKQAHCQKQEQISTEDNLSKLTSHLDNLKNAVADQGERISLSRQDTLYQQYHLRQLLSEIKGEMPVVTPGEATRYLDEYLDAYYIAFEDANRGTLDEIRQKLSIYLPYITRFKEKSGELPLLDIGCGRGEWLGLLQDAGISAYGVDMNGVMVTVGQERGLDVRHEDGLAHLQKLPDHSLSVITSFHVIEHLPFAVLFSVLIEIKRVLIPGGLLILETPNPENVLVGSHTFYHDFTHRNPVTPSALTFLLTYHNFQNIEVLRLHPYPEEAKVPGHDPLTERVNGHLCGPQDFAMIAYQQERAGKPE
ncbi:methyltransferase domain-containing protein [Thiothrix litoralis]|uniref:Methyltransferase domain-containing protein n=1 Tax=Thiothrix litoralis TaxID=2891210 RepID=A0ABX7WRS6_9GAMM|nr:class I SAM-dependent methyltransferase [Thiothrix litoralis]QTR46384.1 methyltransferase domain-containing protein [Thiothrix litoralis]